MRDDFPSSGFHMSYQVLARKWRPKSFAELVGQEHVVRALSNALTQQRLHHAYLFTGTRGVGKTTVARILAKALNCETGITAEPCGQCAACVEIDKGRFVDLLELDAASNTGIDNMRDVLDSAQYAPTSGRFKVYIIDEVHMLSKSAFNSMLKTLEEPPEHVKFILATTDPQKVPVTVLSRCLQFNLKQMSPLSIVEHLKTVLSSENISAEPAALQLLARAAQGSMRDALSLLDQAIAYGGNTVHEQEVRAMLGAIDQGYLFSLLQALADQDGAALIAQAEAMEERSLSFDAALGELAALLHQVALAQNIPQAIAEDLPERAQLFALAQRISAEQAQLFYQIALLGRRDLALAPDEFAGFTMCLLRMLAFMPQEKAASAASAPTPGVTKVGGSAAVEALANTPTPAPPAPTPIAAHHEDSLTEKLQAIQQIRNEVEKNAPAQPAFDGDWRALTERLKLSGLAKVLAQHCELSSHDEHSMRLSVPQAHKHLLEAAYQEKLKTTLRGHFGRHFQVHFDIGGSASNTPAHQLNLEKASRQAQAEEAIQNDEFVRELVDSFGAQIVPSSIKPIQ